MESSGQYVIKKIRFWAFFFLLVILYITNRINTERILSNSVKESNQLEDILLEYKLLKAHLMQAIDKAEMIKKAEKYGLIEPKTPPIVITIKENY